jgi:ABC-type spermidine/putrescine transport system permease subunit I
MRTQASAKAALATVVVCWVVAVPFAEGASTRIPARWRSCKAVNAKYLHGVGR